MLEMMFGKKAPPVWCLLASSALVAVGLELLVAAPSFAPACIVLYCVRSGIRSIAQRTVQLSMFGRVGYAVLMGRLGLPTLLATAAAPLGGIWLLERVELSGTLACLFGAAPLHVTLVVPMALKLRRGAAT